MKTKIGNMSASSKYLTLLDRSNLKLKRSTQFDWINTNKISSSIELLSHFMRVRGSGEKGSAWAHHWNKFLPTIYSWLYNQVWIECKRNFAIKNEYKLHKNVTSKVKFYFECPTWFYDMQMLWRNPLICGLGYKRNVGKKLRYPNKELYISQPEINLDHPKLNQNFQHQFQEALDNLSLCAGINKYSMWSRKPLFRNFKLFNSIICKQIRYATNTVIYIQYYLRNWWLSYFSKERKLFVLYW